MQSNTGLRQHAFCSWTCRTLSDLVGRDQMRPQKNRWIMPIEQKPSIEVTQAGSGCSSVVYKVQVESYEVVTPLKNMTRSSKTEISLCCVEEMDITPMERNMRIVIYSKLWQIYCRMLGLLGRLSRWGTAEKLWKPHTKKSKSRITLTVLSFLILVFVHFGSVKYYQNMDVFLQLKSNNKIVSMWPSKLCYIVT